MHRLASTCGVLVVILLGIGISRGQANAASADFAQTERYAVADAIIAGPTKVLFLGDSLIEYWGSGGVWFTEAGWVNRAIGGQTTSQMLLRERADALSLRPSVLVLEGGGNDMRLGFGVDAIRSNLESMGELAQAHHIAVFVAAMTPVCDCVRPLTGLRTVSRIRELNAAVREMCRLHMWGFLDFYSPLADGNGLMHAEWTVDGVHPNVEGYKKLVPVVEEALGKL